MKYLAILFTVSLLIQSNVLGQFPDTLWTKTFGGIDEDAGFSIQQTLDGGYIICGSTQNPGNVSTDLWLIKTDEQGEVLWNTIYGGDHLDEGYSVQQTNDGGYIVCGRTFSIGNYGHNNLWLIKTDTNGDTVWTKTMFVNEGLVGQSVQQTDDDGYIITGYIDLEMGAIDVLLVRTDANGNIAFIKQYEGSENESGTDVKQTRDGGYIITGSTNFKGHPQLSINLLDNNENNFTSMDGDYDSDLFVIKTDSYGDTVWTKTYGGDGYDCGNSIIETNDDCYIIVGETNSGDSDAWLIKIDYNGDTLWTKKYGVEGKYGCGNSVKLNSQGGYIICGTLFTIFPRYIYIGDLWLIYTNQFGETIYTKTYGGVESEEGYAINYTDDGGYIISGSTESFGAGSRDVWLIKLSPDSVSYTSSGEDVGTYYLYQNFPNPFNPTTTIKYAISKRSLVDIKVYDILGNELAVLINEEQDAGYYELNFNAARLSSGVYFYQLKAGKFIETKKMLLLK